MTVTIQPYHKKLPFGVCVNRSQYGRRWKNWEECQDCEVIENCSVITIQRTLIGSGRKIVIVKPNGETEEAGP